ncbi:hypothetical protein [Amycolatopsis sp. cg9]|uniref:hypothetical protein n=1 Tax=Amycolatopsis sp. cg9 TaxID=3238801 RepID=UPI003524554B
MSRPKPGRLTALAVDGVSDALTATRYIHEVLRQKEPLDAVFPDIEMPGLNGLDLARMIARFAEVTTANGVFSVRVPVSVLTSDWAAAGFVRVDDRQWVAAEHVDVRAEVSTKVTVRLPKI